MREGAFNKGETCFCAGEAFRPQWRGYKIECNFAYLSFRQGFAEKATTIKINMGNIQISYFWIGE